MIEDKNNTEFDLLMRTILENGREEVPDHIWDAVSYRLYALGRRKAALRWRRAAISASIAAALAIGLFLSFRNDTIPDNGEGLLAEVTEKAGTENIAAATSDGAANIPDETVTVAESAASFMKQIQGIADGTAGAGEEPEDGGADTAEDSTGAADFTASHGKTDIRQDDTAGGDGTVRKDGPRNEDETAKDVWKDWPEDDGNTAGSHIRTSIVLSGVTGTNSTRSLAKQNLMKRPTVPQARPKTGITETSTNTTYGIPLSFGAGAKVDLTERWSLGAGLNYTLLSRKFYGNYTKATPEGEVEYSQSSDIRNTQHYVGIPLNVFFNIVDNKYVSFYAYSGGTVEKCIADRYEILSATGTRMMHREQVKGVQLSAGIGIGAEFMIGRHLGIYVDPSLRYYFNNGQPKSIRTAQPLMLGFEMGIRARL